MSGNNPHHFEPIRPHQPHQQPHPELRRPDSVITTTSSIVSSSDENAVDNSNVYTISGLYGPKKQKPHQPQQPQPKDAAMALSSLTSSEAGPSIASSGPSSLGLIPTASNTLAVPAETRVKSSSLQQQRPSRSQQPHHHQPHHGHHKTHRRNTSHPGSFEGDVEQQQQQRPQHVSRGVIVVNSNQCSHRRSNSYGPVHRALTGTASLDLHHNNGPIHRRTASTVIETLQTLACNKQCNVDHHQQQENSIAHFLETLKKEQQEKFEKQELHEMQDELADVRDCGLMACRPKALQPLANIKVFVLLLSMLVTLQQALSSGYFYSVITTIEKRYEIPSSISGIIASMYEIGNVVTVIFVSYLGSRRHIPVWIGMGT